MSQPVSARRRALFALGAAVVAPLAVRLPSALAAPEPPMVEVYKSPTCGCCGDWIKHLEANGFKVKAINVDDMGPMRARLGMPAKYGSCHTAKVGGYLVEGHVPAREIKRLLSEKPKAIGIAVPGMPIGSPGMDGPVYKGMKVPYDVVLVTQDGGAKVYASYRDTR